METAIDRSHQIPFRGILTCLKTGVRAARNKQLVHTRTGLCPSGPRQEQQHDTKRQFHSMERFLAMMQREPTAEHLL